VALGSKSPPPAGSIQPARGANLPGRWIRASRTQNRSVSRAVRVGLVVLGVALMIIAVLDRPGDRLGFTPVPRTQAPADTGCLTIASKVGEAPFCDTGGATPHVNPQIQTTPLRGGPSGVSADTAVRLARSHVADGATVESAEARILRGWTAEAPDRLIWAVTFSTEVDICAPLVVTCMSPRKAQTIVILDYGTGDFVELATYAPQHWPVRAS